MNLRLLIIVLLLLLVTSEPLVTYSDNSDVEFLVAGNVRITNRLSEGRHSEQSERLFSSFMRRWEIAGASVAVAVDGRLVFARGFGYADTEVPVPAEPYHRFRIASVSKLVTAVAVMKLCEDGRMSLSDKVFGEGGLLNDTLYTNPKDKRVYGITVAHLLGHQGGWTSRYGDHMFITMTIAKQMGRELPLSTQDYIRFALDRNLHFTPGTGRAYSNLGYAILGEVVAGVSGMSYEEYCRKELFEPLGIHDMALGKNLETERLLNEVKYYEHEASIPKFSVYGTKELVPASYGGNDIESLGGAGGWIATAPDLMRLLLAIDGLDDVPDILSQESISRMTDNSNGYAPLGWKSAYGNGVWWRTGFFPGSTAMAKRLPSGVSWVVLLNTSAWNGPELTNDINTLMSRVLMQVKEWPDVDLFRYSLPVPLGDY
ncbi:MAG: beta-lactamase family protein [Bacteroidetes bacterium]|nr:beta-lactamase family protein [Bacteroidota bacterium]